MFEADSQNFDLARRGFRLKKFWPAFGGDHRGTQRGGVSHPTPPPPPLPSDPPSPPPLLIHPWGKLLVHVVRTGGGGRLLGSGTRLPPPYLLGRGGGSRTKARRRPPRGCAWHCQGGQWSPPPEMWETPTSHWRVQRPLLVCVCVSVRWFLSQSVCSWSQLANHLPKRRGAGCVRKPDMGPTVRGPFYS